MYVVSIRFLLLVMIKPFHPMKTECKCQSLNGKRWKYKQFHMKVLLNSLHLNGHTLGCNPLIQKVERRSLGIRFNTTNVCFLMFKLVLR